MRPRRVTILDLVTKGPTNSLYARVMNQNLASIMPQVVGVWCEELGHQVRFVCYTGREDLQHELLDETDIVFIGAFTRSALTAYAISQMFRARGAVTVLGGPHARSYPQDAAKYFDYVVGFTDKTLIQDILADCAQHRPLGAQLAAARQPTALPGAKERWKFIEPTIAKAPTSFKVVPMIGSMGCPYTCGFCVDATVDYQPLSFDQISEDLKFLRTKLKRPIVAWHDPNFGVRFQEYMNAIETAIPPDSIDFIAESTLSLLAEPHLKRLKQNGFKAILPGIESWYDMGDKSRTGREIPRHRLRERPPARREIDQRPAAPVETVDGCGCHIRAQHHAGPAAGRRIVDIAVPPDPEGPQVHRLPRPDFLFPRALQDGHAQRPRKRLGKQGNERRQELHRHAARCSAPGTARHAPLWLRL